MRKRSIRVVLLVVGLAILLLAGYFIYHLANNNQADQPTNSESPPKQSQVVPEPVFDKTQHSTTDPNSIWVVVNKHLPLDRNFAANDLRLPDVSQRLPGNRLMQMRDPAASALEKMFNAASQDGIELQITTAYRDYSYQAVLYNGYVASQGQAAADLESARPGFSEHQTGLVADIRKSGSNTCYLETCFGDMPEGKWLAANAHKYGFLLRYPADKTKVTGYSYEPWHFRYIGQELAQEMHRTDITTMEEFFSLGSAEDYL